jgi:hypothetical protein
MLDLNVECRLLTECAFKGAVNLDLGREGKVVYNGTENNLHPDFKQYAVYGWIWSGAVITLDPWSHIRVVGSIWATSREEAERVLEFINEHLKG